MPVWHPDVRFFEIESAAGKPVGGFYLDAYARPHKRSGAWMDDCIGRKRLPSGATLPVAYLVCNFLPPNGSRPALLTHDDVVTLFHEFGHGLHHLLTRVDYPSLAGINGVAWDAVELPSQFLENYAWHPDVLRRISSHVDTGAPLAEADADAADRHAQLPCGAADDAAARIRAVRFPAACRISTRRGAGASRKSSREVRAEVAVVPVPEWNRFPHSFGHVFAGGYAAGYYSYKWAEVLAADAFAAFEEKGVFDQRHRPALPRFHPRRAAARAIRSMPSSSFADASRMCARCSGSTASRRPDRCDESLGRWWRGTHRAARLSVSAR